MRNKRIVTIGGGTGSFVVLSGLKRYPVDISAIVSMADDGGSTGILRDELGVLPPGDARQCLIALSGSSETVRALMSYRFENGGLKGHNFGNLFLSALEKISGSFGAGIEEASAILNVKGTVIPVTQDSIRLSMTLGDGTTLKGENEIYTSTTIQSAGVKKIFLEPEGARAHPKATNAIKQADIVVIGPGTHYSSIIPNLLVKDVARAVRETKAKVVYICNLVNKEGQTEGFTLDDYVRSIESYIGKGRIDLVIFNIQRPPKKLIEKYKNKKELLVTFDGRKEKRTYRVIEAPILNKRAITYSKADVIAAQRSFIRHDGAKIAKILLMLTEQDAYARLVKRIV